MHLFGRTLFGAALVAGYVTASGVAVCGATATGEAQVLYSGAGRAESHASLSGGGLRGAVGWGEAAKAEAYAAASPLANFSGGGSASVAAIAEGIAQASFYGSGVAHADAYADGALYRRVRMAFQPPAKAYASGYGEVVSHVLAAGRPARARATLIGTTHYVGRGVARAFAEISEESQRQVGGRQQAHAEATCSAVRVYIAGAQGLGEATARAHADAAVTKGGERHFELFGTARAAAEASLSHVVIYQPQIMRASAQIFGSAIQRRGFAGKGLATAKATGYMDMTYTGQEGEPAAVTAEAFGYGIRHVIASGVAHCTAQGFGSASADFNGEGHAAPTAAILAKTMHFQLANQPAAQSEATALGQARRTHISAGVTAYAQAEATGFNQINDLTRAPSSRTLIVAGAVRTSFIMTEPRTIRI